MSLKDKRPKKHFKEQKKHTKIKHALFTATLESSLFIANSILKKNSNFQRSYFYGDLFAGTGEFEEDGALGSPTLALKKNKKIL